jgi:hypothetical protein
MKISLLYSELLFDITNKNRSEVAPLDAAVRYRAEIGSDKEQEVSRCLLNALSTLTANYMRFLNSSTVTTATNQSSVPSKIEIDVCGSSRRLAGKTQAIANCMHSLLVNMTLSLFYLSVGQGDLATSRDNLATIDVQVLKKLLYSKRPPLC